MYKGCLQFGVNLHKTLNIRILEKGSKDTHRGALGLNHATFYPCLPVRQHRTRQSSEDISS